ncbi:MAG TPA: SPOR domain-containing protein [Gammaproteobacteria bacterium]|nr:SPOR domain-containing protein [Gammaproteobacteria bacterium]
MNKSQLRKLAREHALGNLDEGEYLHRRRTLIDDIVGGKVAIVREVPPPPPPAYSEDPTTKVSIAGGDRARRVLPAALLIGIVIVAGIIWMLIPGGGQQSGNVDQPVHAPPVSRARSLIDDFVSEKDFSAFSIASFKESWSHLTYAEKREAYSAHWFDSLINLISDEIKAQNALAGSEETANAAEMGRRLSEFASFLGISEYVTQFKGVPAQPTATVAASDPDPGIEASATVSDSEVRRPEPFPAAADASGTDPGTKAATVDAITPGDPAAFQTHGRKDETLSPMPDAEWLDAQPAGAYTLQLFAVSRLDEIQSLIVANPDVDLQLLVNVRNEPRYRVVYGVFDSEDAARVAYAELPESIRRAQPVPLVRSIGSLRDEVGNADQVAAVSASKYTLQVFSTDSADSARRLQADFPALELSLLETTNPYSRYRVLYGIFDSEEMARKAAGGLPRELLQNVGDPLIKTVSELQAVKR